MPWLLSCIRRADEARVKHKVKAKAHAEFSEWADSYDRDWLKHFLFEPAHAMLLKELGRLPRGRSLDIGCGTGELATRLAQRGWQATALDLCESMLRCAKRKTSDELRVDLAAGDSEHLPFPDGAFDVITCANCFHHFPHQQNVLHEMRRALKPGGRLFIVDGWRDRVVGWVLYDLIITHVEGGDVKHRSAEDMRSLFDVAGLQDVSHHRHHGPFPLLLTRGTVPA